MTEIDPFASFIATPYQTAPQFPLQTLAVLSKSLSARMPDDSPDYIIVAEEEMRAATLAAEAAMVIRLRETNERRLRADLNLDNALDGLWSLFRERTQGWSRYERPGLDFLLEDKQLELDFQTVREMATRAGELATKIFGEGAMAMLSKPYPEQSQLMGNVLQLIDTDGVGEELLEIAGPELLPILRRCQQEYETMVDRRASFEPASRADLRNHRAKLQRRIVRYSTLVLTMMVESKPKTRELVETALEPMVTMRRQLSGSSGAISIEDLLGPAAEQDGGAAAPEAVDE